MLRGQLALEVKADLLGLRVNGLVKLEALVVGVLLVHLPQVLGLALVEGHVGLSLVLLLGNLYLISVRSR